MGGDPPPVCGENGIAKKQIARRLGLDVKTVRRAIERAEPPARAAVPRRWRLDPWREQIEGWLRQDRRLTAKRIRRLLLPLAGPIPGRTVRRYVAKLKAELYPREAYVHRSPAPGVSMEVDFGESWAVVGSELHKVKYLVATLPYSNVYFAKAYPIERLESLLDGIQEAFTYFGGVVERVVLDNTSIAVKKVLGGREREQARDHDLAGWGALRVGTPLPAQQPATSSVPAHDNIRGPDYYG